MPAVLMCAAVLLFLFSYSIDRRASDGRGALPAFLRLQSADEARELLGALAAAIITVLRVVFSVTIVALTLASQEFGPRMLRNVIRDLGTQVTLGIFVYTLLTLGAIESERGGRVFVPQLSVAAVLVLGTWWCSSISSTTSPCPSNSRS